MFWASWDKLIWSLSSNAHTSICGAIFIMNDAKVMIFYDFQRALLQLICKQGLVDWLRFLCSMWWVLTVRLSKATRRRHHPRPQHRNRRGKRKVLGQKQRTQSSERLELWSDGKAENGFLKLATLDSAFILNRDMKKQTQRLHLDGTCSSSSKPGHQYWGSENECCSGVPISVTRSVRVHEKVFGNLRDSPVFLWLASHPYSNSDGATFGLRCFIHTVEHS